jgi:hypothetical protein
MRRDQASLANDHSAPALSWPVINPSGRVSTFGGILKQIKQFLHVTYAKSAAGTNVRDGGLTPSKKKVTPHPQAPHAKATPKISIEPLLCE